MLSEHIKLHKTGKHLTEEHRKNISEKITGIPRSEETKQKISESMKGENHPSYGKHWKLVDGKRIYY